MSGRPAIFFDRDGVINVERRDYVKNWGEFEFLPGALDALGCLSGLDADILIVTNQSAIGRGLVTLEVVNDVHRRMIEAIEQHGGRIDAIYICPHTPSDGCSCRKPEPGLIERAVADRGLDIAASVIVGDNPSDVEAGARAGCRCLLLGAGTLSIDLASAIDAIRCALLAEARE